MKILPISTRETTVINLIAWGYSNKAIAERLGLSVKTIETHRYNALRKLKLSDRPAVVRYALEQGWLSVEAASAPWLPCDHSRSGTATSTMTPSSPIEPATSLTSE